MRESTFSYPLQNRACVSITPAVYDRRALDVRSSLPLLNNLTGLTYLTSTSPRIREVMTQDGGLERLLDIMRESCRERSAPPPGDLWGLNGPSTARVLGIDRQTALKHSLAFQCVVNIGVRGSEVVRTRVVQSGALDLVAHILECWMQKRGIFIHPHTLGSYSAVSRYHNGGPLPTRPRGVRIQNPQPRPPPTDPSTQQGDETSVPPEAAAPVVAPGAVSPRVAIGEPPRLGSPSSPLVSPLANADVDMTDSGAEDAGDQSAAEDNSMDVDPAEGNPQTLIASVTAATPRASGSRLPMTTTGGLDIPMRPLSRDEESQVSSGANSLTGSEDGRLVSDNDLPEAGPARHRPAALNLHVPGLAAGGNSNQSSPMGTPTRIETEAMIRNMARRETITARPTGLAPPIRTRLGREAAESDASENGDTEIEQETIQAGIAAAVRAGENPEFEQQIEPPEVAIVEMNMGAAPEEPDPEALAAEQARLDLEAGAPPGQPGAATTPPGPAPTVIEIEPPTPAQDVAAGPAAPPAAPRTGTTVTTNVGAAQVIIANGAPRGFHELAAYVGISTIIHPNGDRFSDDSVLLSLQLLAYLSKYPHVRTAFHHPALPMHRTFEFDEHETLPERPHKSATRNMFSLVERFTFRPSAADPTMFRVPQEIQYWAGVIMRNACRKDDLQNGIRQCAHMNCGKWETFAREFAKCRRCRKAKYCSKACQSAAWSEGHRFWCNPRPDAEAPPDPNAAAGPSSAVLPENLPRAIGGNPPMPIDYDFWELALRLALQNPPHQVMQRMLADITVPTGFDANAIIRWTTQELAPLLWARPTDHDMFLEVVRQQPNVIQSLFIQSMGDPQTLAQGVEMTMMQARLQQQQRQAARRARNGDPLRVNVDGRPQIARDANETELINAVAAVRAAADTRRQAATERARRDTRTAARDPATPADQTLGAGTRTTVQDIPAFRPTPGRTFAAVPVVAQTPAPQAVPVPAPTGPRVPLFGFGRNEPATPTERQPGGPRGFSLTEVWRTMGRGNNNNNNNNNTDTNPDNQGRR